MTTLTKAHHEWAKRSPDERFASLEALHAAACSDREMGAVSIVSPRDLFVKADEAGSLQVSGPTGRGAHFTNWSFGQICKKAEAPPSYLRTLRPSLAAECLNEGLRDNLGKEDKSTLLFKSNGDLTLRAITTDSYSRIWNRDITARLLELADPWQPAPAAFDGSRGLYCGDRDMFAFLVDNDRRIFEKGPGGGLSRGFFVWNSEVGASSFGIQTFMYEYVCGNHRVWGASDIKELRIRHVGEANGRWLGKLQAELTLYAASSASEDEAKIVAAMNFELGKTKTEVLDRLFGLRIAELPMKTIEAAANLAEKREDWYGNPRTVWGMTGAITEIARDLPNAGDRAALERASAKVLEIVF